MRYEINQGRFYDNGMVALLGNNALVSVSSYNEPRPKHLASTPEGDIHSWAIVSPDYTLSRSVEVLLSVNRTVHVVDATDCEDRFLDIGPFSHISVSPDGRFVNLYGVDGKAHLISSDFQERIFEHESDSKTTPKYVEWCGSEALIAWEDEVHIIGPGDTSSSYIYDSTRVHVISGEFQESDVRGVLANRTRIRRRKTHNKRLLRVPGEGTTGHYPGPRRSDRVLGGVDIIRRRRPARDRVSKSG